jgi:hypothetical protein
MLREPAESITGSGARFELGGSPVYAIDVCKKKSLQTCKADDESAWTSLDQWQPDE